MHLKKVVLKNFRCFNQIELDLHPRLTVLVAENGGGKTAVLDGIAIGLSPFLSSLSSASQRLTGVGFADTDFRVETVNHDGMVQQSDFAQVEMLSTDGLHWDNWKPSSKGKQPDRGIGQKNLIEFAASILQSFKSPSPKRLPVFSYYGAGRGSLSIPLSPRLRNTKIDYTQPTSALVRTLNPLNDFKEMLNWFDIEEANELRANKGCNPEDFEASDALVAVRDALVKLLGGTFKNPHFNRQHQFVVDTEGEPGQLQVSQLSQGYQAMLALGMDFARRQAIANRYISDEDFQELPVYKMFMEKFWQYDNESLVPDFMSSVNMAPAIMLVDEIDLHLHPSWQQRVLADLMRAFPLTQFVVTTHSPQILTTLRKENIRILDCDTKGNWHAREPDTSPLAHESGDALAFIVDTHPRPELAKITEQIHAYEKLAHSGNLDSKEAAEISSWLRQVGYEFSAADKALFQHFARKAGKLGESDNG